MADFNEDALLRQTFGPTPDCLSIETLAAMSETRLDAPSMAAAKAHLESCAHCRNEAALLLDFQTAAPSAAEAQSVAWIESRLRTPAAPKQARWNFAEWFRGAFAARRWQTMSLAGACLLFIVAGGIYLRQDREPLTPSTAGQPVWRSLQLKPLAPIGDLAAAPSELTWEAAPGAAKYTVRLFEVDRTEIWNTESSEPRAAIPETLRRQMSAGRTFLWSVAARNAAGRTLAESDLQTFHISVTSR